MKKIIAMVMALCMLCSFALAEDAGTIKQVSWANDIEPDLELTGLTGQFISLEDLGLKVWVPDLLQADELDEGLILQGFKYIFATPDSSAALMISVSDAPGLTLDKAYENAVASTGISEPELAEVNGLPVLTYTNDTANAFAVCLLNGEQMITFSFTPADEAGADGVFFIITCSIQAI